MKLSLTLNFLLGRGLGVTPSPYLGRPRLNSHAGHNFLLNRMQYSHDLYVLGLHFWLVW